MSVSVARRQSEFEPCDMCDDPACVAEYCDGCGDLFCTTAESKVLRADLVSSGLLTEEDLATSETFKKKWLAEGLVREEDLVRSEHCWACEDCLSTIQDSKMMTETVCLHCDKVIVFDEPVSVEDFDHGKCQQFCDDECQEAYEEAERGPWCHKHEQRAHKCGGCEEDAEAKAAGNWCQKHDERLVDEGGLDCSGCREEAAEEVRVCEGCGCKSPDIFFPTFGGVICIECVQKDNEAAKAYRAGLKKAQGIK